MKTVIALVGTRHCGHEAIALLANLPNGSPLTLKREPDNPHDRFAVQVYSGDMRVGYLSANGGQNRSIAGMLDMADVERREITAKLAIDGGKWPLVEVTYP